MSNRSEPKRTAMTADECPFRCEHLWTVLIDMAIDRREPVATMLARVSRGECILADGAIRRLPAETMAACLAGDQIETSDFRISNDARALRYVAARLRGEDPDPEEG